VLRQLEGDEFVSANASEHEVAGSSLWAVQPLQVDHHGGAAGTYDTYPDVTATPNNTCAGLNSCGAVLCICRSKVVCMVQPLMFNAWVQHQTSTACITINA
jgi:hypothetical protein